MNTSINFNEVRKLAAQAVKRGRAILGCIRIENGKPVVTYITDPSEKRDPNNLAWTPTKIGQINVGNYVSQILSKHPRKIVKIDKTSSLITLYEEGRDKPYFKADENYPMDLLIDMITREPVTNLEQYYE